MAGPLSLTYFRTNGATTIITAAIELAVDKVAGPTAAIKAIARIGNARIKRFIYESPYKIFAPSLQYLILISYHVLVQFLLINHPN